MVPPPTLTFDKSSSLFACQRSLWMSSSWVLPTWKIEVLSLTPKLNFKYHWWKTEPFPFFILSKRVIWCEKCIFLAIYSTILYKICPMKNVRSLKFGNVLFKVHCILCRKTMVLLLKRVSIEKMITNKLCIFNQILYLIAYDC